MTRRVRCFRLSELRVPSWIVKRSALLTFNSAEVVGLCLLAARRGILGERAGAPFGTSLALPKPIGSRGTC